ncbi:hypothetical protein GEMRC1_010736 [Eukaryota sp. GEM-RC1]
MPTPDHRKRRKKKKKYSSSSPDTPSPNPLSSANPQHRQSKLRLGLHLDDSEFDDSNPSDPEPIILSSRSISSAKSKQESSRPPSTHFNRPPSTQASRPHSGKDPNVPSLSIPNASPPKIPSQRPPTSIPLPKDNDSNDPSLSLSLQIPDESDLSNQSETSSPAHNEPQPFRKVASVTATLLNFKKKVTEKREARLKRMQTIFENQKNRVLSSMPLAIHVHVVEDALPVVMASVEEYIRQLGRDHPVTLQAMANAKRSFEITGTTLPNLFH